MISDRSHKSAERFMALARMAGALVAAIGALGIVGWITGNPRLTRFVLAYRPIVPHTALALVLGGGSLALRGRASSPATTAALAGMGLAIVAACVGAVEVDESIVGHTLLLDRFFPTPHPTVVTGLEVFAVAAALLLLDVRVGRRRLPPAQYLALALMLPTLVMTAAYIYREPIVHDVLGGPGTALGLSLPASAGITLLSFGLVCARPDAGLMEAVASDDVGGLAARRSIVFVLVAPLIGLIGMLGERLELWDQDVAEALLAVAGMGIGTGIVVVSARSLNGLDARRRRALDEAFEWKEFFDRAARGAAFTTPDGRILKANPAYARMHGYDLAELEALPVVKLVSDSEREKIRDSFARIESLGHVRFECERERKDGTHFPAVVDATALRRSDGTVSRCIAYVQDISEQKEAERVQARLAAIVESSEDAIVSFDNDGIFLTANPAIERLLGFSVKELIGRPTTDFMPPELQKEIAAHLDRIRRGERVTTLETVHLRKDGTRVAVSVTTSPVYDRQGRITMFSGIVRDITAQKELERRREEWASLVAHDLRQPLAAISLNAQVLAKRVRRPGPVSSESVVELADKILTSARRLDRMVDDLTDLSRIEAKRLKLDIRAIDLEPLVHSILEGMALFTAGNPVRISARGTPRRISVDPARIEQVIGNLLTNAIKYGEPRTEIAIDIEWRETEVEIAVTNCGRGIPANEIGRLFSRFERTTDARCSGTPGLGLGLYICRGLVEAHGGRIWVESVLDGATTFRFTLPAPPLLERRPANEAS